MRGWMVWMAWVALAAGVARAQTAALGDLRLASRVTTNEQDAAALAALAAHAPGHGLTADGGFAGGSNATATTGGAIGLWATETAGGGAVGAHAASRQGGAVGELAASISGGAVGLGSVAQQGGAVGDHAATSSGGAVGMQATTSDGFAGGMAARAEADGMPIDAIQLGTGRNPDAKSLQVYGHKLMDAEGRIPVERTPWVPGWGDVTNIVGWVVTTNNTVINNYWGGSVTEIYVIITNLAPYAAVTGIVEWGVSPIWTVIDGHTNWHSHTPEGGFWGGSNATATTGGAIGLHAVETAGGFAGGNVSGATTGGAVGYSAGALAGGAVGERAAATAGGAVGKDAIETEGGFAGGSGASAASGGAAGDGATAVEGGAVGAGASAAAGGAVGAGASASTGGAVGFAARSGSGGAVGESALAGDGFAGGYMAITKSGENVIDAVQLGRGTNPDAGTLQVYDYKLMDADGTIPVERIPAAITNGLLSQAGAAATYLSATPGWFWQGSQAVVTNGWTATLGGYAAVTNGESAYALVPYTTTRHDVTGSVEIVSGQYIVGVGCDWYVAVPEDMSIPKTPVHTASERLGPTSWVLRAWCSVNPEDANPYYYGIISNLTVMTYDRIEMRPGAYTNDAAGIVSRVDDAPTTDARRAVNVGTLTAYVDGRKDEIADRAWRRTPSGRDAPSAYTVTIDQPLVQQGQMGFLNSGDYYCMSYEGGDWYSAPTGSVWRIGPSGTAAFEIQATNRVLFVQGFAVAGGYATLDIATNWVTDGYAPEIEYTETLDNPQWLACPEQTMTNMVSYWRGVCPATADTRFFRAVLRNGASLIKSHYAHEFAGDIILFGQRYASLAELKAALEALP